MNHAYSPLCSPGGSYRCPNLPSHAPSLSSSESEYDCTSCRPVAPLPWTRRTWPLQQTKKKNYLQYPCGGNAKQFYNTFQEILQYLHYLLGPEGYRFTSAVSTPELVLSQRPLLILTVSQPVCDPSDWRSGWLLVLTGLGCCQSPDRTSQNWTESPQTDCLPNH